MNQPDTPRVGFAPAEIKAFRYHAILAAAIGAGMYAAAPNGAAQVLGILFAVILLVLPPVVIYIVRRGKHRK